MPLTTSGKTRSIEGRSRRRLRMPGGIRARVTTSAVLVVALTLILAGVLLSFLVRQSLIGGIDTNLASRAQTVASQAASTGGIHGTIPATAQQSSLVQVLDANGTVIAATENMRDDDDHNKYDDPVLSHPPRSPVRHPPPR